MLFLDNSYKCQNIGNVCFFSSFPFAYLLLQWKSQLPIFHYKLIFLGTPFKISMLHCCTCCLSFLKTIRNSVFFVVFLPLMLICLTSSEHWFLFAPPLHSWVCPKGIIGVSFPTQETLRHRYMQILCIICAMFHIGRSKHIECCHNWSNA